MLTFDYIKRYTAHLLLLYKGFTMQFSSAIVNFYLFYDGSFDMQIWTLLTRSQCRISDIQVIVKVCGPLFNGFTLHSKGYKVWLYSAFLAFEESGSYSALHLLWHGEFVYYGSHRGDVTLAPVVENSCLNRFMSVAVGDRTLHARQTLYHWATAAVSNRFKWSNGFKGAGLWWPLMDYIDLLKMKSSVLRHRKILVTKF